MSGPENCSCWRTILVTLRSKDASLMFRNTREVVRDNPVQPGTVSFSTSINSLVKLYNTALMCIPRILAVVAGSALHAVRGDFPVVLTSPQHYKFTSSQPLRHGFDPQCRNTWGDFGVQMPVKRITSWVIIKVRTFTYFQLAGCPIGKNIDKQSRQSRQYQQGDTHLQDFSTLYRDDNTKVMTIPIYSCGIVHHQTLLIMTVGSTCTAIGNDVLANHH